MYNLPEMRADNAAFWQAIRAELIRAGCRDLPERLDFDRKPVPDRIEPNTLLTQVCGWPLQTIYAGQAVLLGVPAYRAAHCVGPTHAGVFVVHARSNYESLAALRGCRFVYNSILSNSGMNLPRRMIAPLAAGRPFFGTIAETHSQPGNLERVASGEADATCVDCVTYAFFARHRPHIAQHLRILAATSPSPAIPFVTAAATAPDLQAALSAALFRVAQAAEWSDVRAGLLLNDIVAPDQGAYQIQRAYEREAAQLGYPVLI